MEDKAGFSVEGNENQFMNIYQKAIQVYCMAVHRPILCTQPHHQPTGAGGAAEINSGSHRSGAKLNFPFPESTPRTPLSRSVAAAAAAAGT